MSKMITDRKLLSAIHDRYYSEFCSYTEDKPSRSSKLYVPINCEGLANELGLDADIVFGRLYYHLDRKYGYKNEDGSSVNLFAMRIGKDHHAVNFPLLSAVVAELEQSYHRFTLPIVISTAAFLISVISYIAGATG